LGPATDGTYQQLVTNIPVLGEYDVVVCGAGPAGIGAAIAAGRRGARTLLVEHLAHVGGMGAGTSVNTWCDTQGGAIFDELEARMDALGKAKRRFNPLGHTYEKGRLRLHGQTLKAVALRMIKEAGVDVLLNTTAAQAWMDQGRVAGVVVANKGGLSLGKAKSVVDATADADVAASAGAECLKGDPEDGRVMHVNFMYQIAGVDREKCKEGKLEDAALIQRIKQAHADGRLHVPTGVFRPAAECFPYHRAEEAFVPTYWEIEKVDCSDPLAVSATLEECQLIALEVLEFCRANVPGYENAEIGRFWDLLGTRESRRIVGRYTVTREDVLSGRKFPDGIAQACFFIDFHDSPPGNSIPYTLEFKQRNTPPAGDWYEIPYRCLLPEQVEGLLVAGRCISAERDALASLRVMPTCMYLGQAAGTAAAMAAECGVLPHELPGEHVRECVIA